MYMWQEVWGRNTPEEKEWTEIRVERTEEITAFAELSIPVLRYNFGNINWRLGEIKHRKENKSN